MKTNHLSKITILLIAVIAVSALCGVCYTVAYLTGNEFHINKTSVSENDIEIIEKFEPPEELTPGENEYVKEVSVKNVGTQDVYIRVSAKFESEKIAEHSILTADGSHWFKASTKVNDGTAYKDHLPAGWVYYNDDALGGEYYYYTIPVKAEIKNDNGTVIQQAQTTPKLFTHIMTDFGDGTVPVPYDVYIYAESVQTYDRFGIKPTGSDAWKKVWQSYYTLD